MLINMKSDGKKNKMLTYCYNNKYLRVSFSIIRNIKIKTGT